MAQKRMFDRAIIDTDRFMDMPIGTKGTYFLLGMEADDEGFVSHKKVMRIHGISEDDVKLLAVKGFIVLFESGVSVITDWHVNNYLDKNRIRPTEYQDERKMLSFTKSGKYVLNNGLTSIEESSIEQNKTEYISAGNLPAKKPLIAKTVKPKKTTFSRFGKKGSMEAIIFNDEVKKMAQSRVKGYEIIGAYMSFREETLKKNIRTKGQLYEFCQRHIRDANKLSAWDDKMLDEAFEKADKEHTTFDWTLSTLLKDLTK